MGTTVVQYNAPLLQSSSSDAVRQHVRVQFATICSRRTDVRNLTSYVHIVSSRISTGPARICFFCRTLNPSPSAGCVCGLKGSTHLCPGTRLACWSRRLGQHSRTASTHNKQTQLTTLFTRALTLSTMGNQTLRRKNPNTTGIEPSFFPPRGGRRTSTPPGRGGTGLR